MSRIRYGFGKCGYQFGTVFFGFFSYDINNFVQGECCVTSECYGVMTQHLMTVCKGKVIVALEVGT